MNEIVNDKDLLSACEKFASGNWKATVQWETEHHGKGDLNLDHLVNFTIEGILDFVPDMAGLAASFGYDHAWAVADPDWTRNEIRQIAHREVERLFEEYGGNDYILDLREAMKDWRLALYWQEPSPDAWLRVYRVWVKHGDVLPRAGLTLPAEALAAFERQELSDQTSARSGRRTARL